MGIREQKERGNLLKSTNPQLVESDGEDEYTAAGGSHSAFKYAGTEFEQSVQAFLSQHVDTTETFLDKYRSMFNQQSMREVRVSVIGPGCTHGEVDAFKERPYLYSLRTVTSNCVVYEVDSSEALMVIKAAAKDKDGAPSRVCGGAADAVLCSLGVQFKNMYFVRPGEARGPFFGGKTNAVV